MSESVPRDCPRCGERFRKDGTCNTEECLNFRPSAKGAHLKEMNQRRTGARSMNKVVKRLPGKISFEVCVASGRIQRTQAYKASLSAPRKSPEPAAIPNSASSPNCESPVRSPSRDACTQMGEPTWATPPFAAKPAAAQPDLQARAASTAAVASKLPLKVIRAKRPRLSSDADFELAALRLMSDSAVVAAPSTPSRKATSAAHGVQRPRPGRDTNGMPTFGSMRAAWRDLGCDYVGGIAAA